jgi:hypothetical protein
MYFQELRTTNNNQEQKENYDSVLEEFQYHILTHQKLIEKRDQQNDAERDIMRAEIKEQFQNFMDVRGTGSDAADPARENSSRN